MAATIENLPDELLVEILGNLSKKDLQKARFTCSRWSTASARWMFQRVYFAPRNATMRTFLNIIANPSFAQNVKESIYDGRLFLPELENSESYSAAFRARVLEEFDIYKDHTRNGWAERDFHLAHKAYESSLWNMESLGCGWEFSRLVDGDRKEFHANIANSLPRYSRLLEQQDIILANGKDFEALSEGFKVLRNMKRVRALVDIRHESLYWFPEGDSPDWYINSHEWYASRSNRELGLTVPPSRWCRRPRSMDGAEQEQEEHIEWDIRGVQNLFRAISTHCPSLREFFIASSEYKAPMTIFQLNDTDTEKVRTMAHRLTCLSVRAYVTKSDNSQDCARQLRCLELLLQEANNLLSLVFSKLSLDYDEDGPDNGSEDLLLSDTTAFRPLLGKSWPHLTRLDLGPGCIRAKDLMSILQAHTGSLHDLTLWDISLIGQRWEDFSNEVGRILELKTVSTHGLHNVVNREGPHRGLFGTDEVATLLRNMMPSALPDELEIETPYHGAGKATRVHHG